MGGRKELIEEERVPNNNMLSENGKNGISHKLNWRLARLSSIFTLKDVPLKTPSSTLPKFEFTK